MPVVRIDGADGPAYLQRQMQQIRGEAWASAPVYEAAAKRFHTLSQNRTVSCMLVDPFHRRITPVEVAFDTQDEEMKLRRGHVRSLLGLTILDETHPSMSYRHKQFDKPRHGEPICLFNRWTGTHLHLPAWRVTIGRRASSRLQATGELSHTLPIQPPASVPPAVPTPPSKPLDVHARRSCTRTPHHS